MDFIEKYGHPEWPVKFRPGAPFTTPFGLDDTFRDHKTEAYPEGRQLRIHTAVDRGSEPETIYAPFDIDSVEYHAWGGGFGALLFLRVKDADFEIRIAHMSKDDLSETVKEALGYGGEILARSILGKAGSLGLSVGGAHTHTEVVSLGKRSQELDWLAHYWSDKEAAHDITKGEVAMWASNHNLDPEVCLRLYQEERDRRSIIQLNQARCVRMDYKTGYRDKRTFYNSNLLFNGV